ncbi:hypothetical protein P175DRAFT_0517324 [Aspergillus ochraceoroseus IBT 24754]|uniref:Archaemetzincin-2 n=1 Tax=Aspergillus ochraceoroseus IBT 24754 TaxID=1392256 RepID=A0A2T5LVR9_9EURO|nr:uncharacterized protein P175DRAFT_0517324 [Aspergillus ochraceoroseus IBT 24754]PTU20369.1 hypothetical protein P175DRAFT_0517324 [Aspergillus ochraceoroseus IBT 24754]
MATSPQLSFKNNIEISSAASSSNRRALLKRSCFSGVVDVLTTPSYIPSTHAGQPGYKQPSAKERRNATKPISPSKLKEPPYRYDLNNFPAALILPDDDLALDPGYPPQCFQEWHDDKDRNPIQLRRKTVYLTPPSRSQCQSQSQFPISAPEPEDVLDYLSAFYHGLPVKRLEPSNWEFSPWTENAKSKGRLNLDDLLDAAISILPSDAYALCMMVDDDLYEDEEDTFVCGRAYGGSRVAVVSSARYNPVLDAAQSVEREHAWPASHCKSYLEASCTKAGSTRKRRKSAPLEAALAAFSTLLSKLWLARICRTVSHELGHCFGIDYCVYYACACLMQGSASLSEDARQPPCLCPVDLAKLLFVTGMTVEARYQALLEFCEKVGIRELAHFAAYAAWLRASLAVTGSGCLY